MDDEDYWNRSDLKAFNFEDEHVRIITLRVYI